MIHEVEIHGKVAQIEWMPYANRFVTIKNSGERIDTEGMSEEEAVDYAASYLHLRCGGFIVDQYQYPIYPGKPHELLQSKRVNYGSIVSFLFRDGNYDLSITAPGKTHFKNGYVEIRQVPDDKRAVLDYEGKLYYITDNF